MTRTSGAPRRRGSISTLSSRLSRTPCENYWPTRSSRHASQPAFLGLASDSKAGRLVEEGASYVLPDFSDPVRVSACPEAVARKLWEGGRRESQHPASNHC